jgi:hypothetical protein
MYPAQGHPSYFFTIHFNAILPLLSGLQQIYCNKFKLTNSLSHSLIHLITHSLTRSLTHSLTHSLTRSLANSKEEIPLWEANTSSANKEIPHIIWKPKVHYSIHNNPAPVPILSHSNPVHATPSNVFKIHFIPSMPRYSNWSLSLRFPQYCIFALWIANWKAKDFVQNDSKHSLISICSYCLHEWNLDLLGLFPNIWTIPPFQRIYYLSFCGDFVPHAGPEACSFRSTIIE